MRTGLVTGSGGVVVAGRGRFWAVGEPALPINREPCVKSTTVWFPINAPLALRPLRRPRGCALFPPLFRPFGRLLSPVVR